MLDGKTTVYYFISDCSVSFVQSDIGLFAKNFREIILVTDKMNTAISYPGVTVKHLSYANYSTSSVFLKNPLLISYMVLSELSKSIKYFANPGLIKSTISNLLRCFYLKNEIIKLKRNGEADCLFYTFWFNNWATALAILTREKKIPRYYSRVHGTDLYEERLPVTKKIPFRKFQLKYIDKLFSVSRAGELYLKKKYTAYASKINTCYLGTDEHGKNPFDPNGIFTLVSCANVRNIKRLHLVPLILQHLDFKVRWIHIGEEKQQPGDPTITEYFRNKDDVSRAHPDVEMISKGKLTSEEIFKLYSSVSINLFISVSETEGLPISMMEAISFGIPVLATDVGGCKEIVTDQTGILIENNFDPEQAAEAISAFRVSKMNSLAQREVIMEFWKKHFNSEANFRALMNQLN